MAKIAINGFGRIGRAFYKLALEKPELEIVAINDLGDPDFLAYLLRFDSAYGSFDKEVKIIQDEGKTYLDVAGKLALFLQEKEPTALPWKDLGVDIVLESTGVFETFEKAAVHKQAGAKKVVISAPAKDDDTADAMTLLVGVSEDKFGTCSVSSNGSCTTNSISPVMQILVEKLGVKKAYLNTTHSYTATQTLIDGPVPKSKDYRRGRSAAMNIVPSSTGAAVALGRVIKPLEGKFDGMALRVPTITGSISSITFVSEKPTTVEGINKIFTDAEKDPRWQGILQTTTDQLVSTDIIGNPHAAIVDLSLTKVVDGDLCAVYSWYDNEFGYTNTLVSHVLKVAQKL